MKTIRKGIRYTSIYGKDTPDVELTTIIWDCELIEYNTYCEVIPRVREVLIEFEDGTDLKFIDSSVLFAEFEGDISEEIFPYDVEIDYEDDKPYVQVNFGRNE